MLADCPECRYSLEGLPANHRCPECGFEYDDEMVCWHQPRMSRIAGIMFWVIVAIPVTLKPFTELRKFLVCFFVFYLPLAFYLYWKLFRMRGSEYLCVGRRGILWRFRDDFVEYPWSEVADYETGGFKLNDGTVVLVPKDLLLGVRPRGEFEEQVDRHVEARRAVPDKYHEAPLK